MLQVQKEDLPKPKKLSLESEAAIAPAVTPKGSSSSKAADEIAQPPAESEKASEKAALPMTVLERNTTTDPTMSEATVSDLAEKIKAAQKGNKEEKKAVKQNGKDTGKASAAKTKAKNKKPTEEKKENPLDPESDLSEPDSLDSDEDPAFKAGVCCWDPKPNLLYSSSNFIQSDTHSQNCLLCVPPISGEEG